MTTTYKKIQTDINNPHEYIIMSLKDVQDDYTTNVIYF